MKKQTRGSIPLKNLWWEYTHVELFYTTPLNWHKLAFALVDSRSEKWPEAFSNWQTLCESECRSSVALLVERRRLKLGRLSDEIVKTKVLCHCRCSTIKNPPLSKTIVSDHRPKHDSLAGNKTHRCLPFFVQAKGAAIYFNRYYQQNCRQNFFRFRNLHG